MPKSRRNVIETLALFLGTIFASFLFLPWGTYHSIIEPYIADYLYGYKLPFGWVSFVCGLLIVLHQKTRLSGIMELDSFMMAGGLAILISLLLPRGYFINLWHGVNHVAWDVESSLLILPFLLASLCVATGLISRAIRC
jgi:hypothetical protein